MERDDTKLFELQQLCKNYRMGSETVHALDHVSLTIERGEYLAILGPSGSGKSTLMHLLGFMDTPSDGEMIFDGRPVARIGSSERARYRCEELGFIFQSFNLLPRLNVMDNVLLPISYSREVQRDRRERAREALGRVGMSHRARHKPNQLSGGERQRVSIARALINRPKLVLADEPTGALDSVNVERVLELFDELVDEGLTMVMVTHDLDVASHARRVVHMRDGKIEREERREPSVRSSHSPHAASQPVQSP
ncbi:MAG: ABC transporter ATP-binding protein [Opitutales bacterium]